MPLSTSEASVEAEIKTKGLTGPRVTPELIDSKIVWEWYVQMPGVSQLTVCILRLENGFEVTGESACADPANFDAALGKRIARDNARNKIWALEGYLLKERLSAPPDDVARVAQAIQERIEQPGQCYYQDMAIAAIAAMHPATIRFTS